MLTWKQLRVVGVLGIRDALPGVDVVTGFAGRTGSPVLLLMAVGAGDLGGQVGSLDVA